MKRIAFCMLLFLAACSSDITKEPSDLIDKEILENIIADISKSNAAVEMAKVSDNEWIKAKKLDNYKVIFEHYNISEEQFELSYRYYLSDLDSATAIYDRVLEKLSIEEIELNKTDNNE